MDKEEGRWRLFMVGEREPLYATPEVMARIAELEAKADHGLTPEEFAELRGLQDFGGDEAVVEVGDTQDVGVTRPRVTMQNLQSLDQRAQAAFHHGFYLEAISLTLLVLDFGLRAYLFRKTKKPVELGRWFSTMIKQAGEAGLDEGLVRRLRDFNNKRTAAIHHLLIGETEYENLRETCLASAGLIDEVLTATATED